jgi:FkbM family methyltransferase
LSALGSLARLAGRRANTVLKRLGYQVTRRGPEFEPSSMMAGLQRAAERGIRVESIIDVGASDGRWTEGALRFFPNARALLIEANRVHEAGLQSFKQRFPRADYVLAAGGREVGEVYFNDDDPFGGAAFSTETPGTNRIPSTTIDHEVAARSLPGPFLVKLDTHGFEVPILEGAAKTLRDASLLVIEVYNFTLMPGALRFQEMIALLEKSGFRPIDLCDPMYRPKDGAFWQCDMFFVRADRPEFGSNTYA